LVGIVNAAHGQTLRLLFTGDVMQHDANIAAARVPGTDSFSYEPTFRFITPVIEWADIAVANLETTHAGAPYTGYPQFCAPDELSYQMKQSGFDLIITANNHSCDKGLHGIYRTLEVLDDTGLLHTGTFFDDSHRHKDYPFIMERHGFRIAFLNCTYGTNGIDIPSPAIVNLIDTAELRADIAKARSLKPDLVILTIHWGQEYARIAGPDQTVIGEWALRHGVDFVVGMHPHVIQPMERRGNQLIAWSLGNFLSNQRKRYTDGGAVLLVEVSRQDSTIVIDRAGYMLEWVYPKREADGRTTFYILPATTRYNRDTALVSVDAAAEEQMEVFLADSRSHLTKYNRGGLREMLYDTLIFEKAPWSGAPVVHTRKIRYAIQIGSSSGTEIPGTVPAGLHNQVWFEKNDTNYRLLVGRYFDRHVAEGFRRYFHEHGFKGCAVRIILEDEKTTSPNDSL
jgi:poly-gamma-glutamate synthesis protein (capsule biosynthesis protein)